MKSVLMTIILFLALLVILGCGAENRGGNALGTTISSIPDNPPMNSPPSNDPPPLEEPPADIPPSEQKSVELQWNAPKTNVDGSALTDLAGYNVYYRQLPKAYKTPSKIDKQFQTASISGLTSGIWCFAVSAYDYSGNESKLFTADEVCANL